MSSVVHIYHTSLRKYNVFTNKYELYELFVSGSYMKALFTFISVKTQKPTITSRFYFKKTYVAQDFCVLLTIFEFKYLTDIYN